MGKVNEELPVITDSWLGAELRVLESIDTPVGDYSGVVLATMKGPALDYIHDTRNKRGYEEELWDDVATGEYVQELLDTKNFLGEPDHPMQWENRSDIHYPYVSHAIRSLDKNIANGCYDVVIDILDTPNGRILKTLIDYGTKLGVSSRGTGRVINKGGRTIVDKNTYRFITIDVVAMPGNKSARMNSTNESTDLGSELVNQITEQVEGLIDSGNKEMLESAKSLLNHLGDSQYDSIIEKVDKYLGESKESNTNTNVDLYKDLVEAYGIISKLNNEASSKDSIIDGLNEKILNLENMQNTSSDIQDKYDKSVSLVQEVMSELHELKESYSVLESTNSELVSSNQNLSKELSNSTLRANRLASRLKSVREEINESNDQAESDQLDLVNKYESAQREIDTMTEQLNFLSTNCNEISERYVEIRCKQVGISSNLVLPQLKGKLESCNLSKLDFMINESFKSSSVSPASKIRRGYDSIVSGSYANRNVTLEESLEAEELSSLTSSVRLLRNM